MISDTLQRLTSEGWNLKPELRSSLLDADLRKLSSGGLPDDVNRINSGNVKGPLVLQVMSVADISRPSYATNASSRQLLLKLSDGRVTCKALEHKTCSQLTDTLLPGSKVVLSQASVKCGVLLLEPKAITILGGREDSLAEAWETQKRYGGTNRQAAASTPSGAAPAAPGQAAAARLASGTAAESSSSALAADDGASAPNEAGHPVLLGAASHRAGRGRPTTAAKQEGSGQTAGRGEWITLVIWGLILIITRVGVRGAEEATSRQSIIMQGFARLAKSAGQRAAVPVAAGAAGIACAPTSHADAPRSSVGLLQDSWELADVDKDVVLFKPDEIDDAFKQLLVPSRASASAVLDELESDSSSSSDGTVDAILERSLPISATAGGLPLDMQELCMVARKLLQSPGVQREICCAALEDPEVFGILASKVDLPEYLQSTGFAARGLLAASEASDSSCVVTEAEAERPPPPAADNLMAALSGKVAEGIENIGLAVARLGRWMRVQLLGSEQAAAEGEAAAEPSAPLPKRLDAVLGAAMVVCVAVVALLVLKRPSALRGLLRRCRR
eukprot:gene13629-13755_t